MSAKKEEGMFSDEKGIVKKEETAVATVETRATGTESVHAEDVQIPRYRLIQATSKEAEDGTTRPGTIKHSTSGEEFQAVQVILISMVKNRVMFDPENRRGGPICRSFDLVKGSGCECGCDDNCRKCEYAKGFPSQCNIMYNYPSFTTDAIGKDLMPTILTFMKSSVPCAQKINASVIGKVPAKPFWCYVWEISSVKKEYKKGRSAFTYNAKQVRETTEEEAKWAKTIYDTFFKDEALARQRVAEEIQEEEV